MDRPRKQVHFAKPAAAQGAGRGGGYGPRPAVGHRSRFGIKMSKSGGTRGRRLAIPERVAGNGAGLILDLRFLI